jgi:hypothetical protein
VLLAYFIIIDGENSLEESEDAYWVSARTYEEAFTKALNSEKE